MLPVNKNRKPCARPVLRLRMSPDGADAIS